LEYDSCTNCSQIVITGILVNLSLTNSTASSFENLSHKPSHAKIKNSVCSVIGKDSTSGSAVTHRASKVSGFLKSKSPKDLATANFP